MSGPRIDTVTWGAEAITYQYHQVRRRTLGISVYPDMSVIVRAPHWTSREEIRRFVMERAAWIAKARKGFEESLQQSPRGYLDGEIHSYLGNEYRLKIERGETGSVRCDEGHLCVTVAGEPQPEAVKALLMKWYRDQAAVIFPERLKLGLSRTIGLGIPAPRLTIRAMTSRWGSCSNPGRITLNLLLVTVPMECIDYIVLHELCHFKVGRHGPRFWRLVERFMPDYKERRKKLNTYKL